MSTPNIDQESLNTSYQKYIAHRKNSILVGLAGLGIGLSTRHLLGKRTLPVSTGGEMFWTFVMVTLSSAVGDELTRKMM